MRTIKTLLGAAMLLVAANAWAQSSDSQPTTSHAYYGRDGFWHCEAGYVAGESGACEEIKEGWRYSTFTRLRRADEEASRSQRTTQN